MTIATTHVSQLGQQAYRQPFRHDRWAGITHLIGTDDVPLPLAPGLRPWMTGEDRRRLLAYMVLQSMVDNVRRHWLPSHMWTTKPLQEGSTATSYPAALQFREYGDAKNLVDTARSLVLGEEQRPRVPAAEPRRDASGRLVTPSAGDLAVQTQEWLEKWCVKEKIPQKLIETENRVIPLGDGALVMHWDGDVQRPRLEGYDPGFVFPDWGSITSKEFVQQGWKDTEFPPVVHLAWEWEDEKRTVWIRRATFRMRRLSSPVRLPYRDEPAVWTCDYEQHDYDPALLDGADVYSFPKRAIRTTLVPTVDLKVDFLPVVLVPNDYPGSERWGLSLLIGVAQILDDLAGADTDMALSAETVATPQLVGKNLTREPSSGAAGWTNLFGDQDIKLLDTATVLDALLKHQKNLRDRMAQNSRLGQVLLGLVPPNEVPSGYALRLGFASVESLEREMTRVRAAKYALLLKMAASFASANGLIPAGPLPEIQMVLGKGLPSDRAATMSEVTELLGAKAISTLTAVMMLMEAGVPIEDAQAEVARIQRDRTDVAVGFIEALGPAGIEAAAEYLGIKVSEEDLQALKQPPQDAAAGGDPGANPDGGNPGSPQPPDGNSGGQGGSNTNPPGRQAGTTPDDSGRPRAPITAPSTARPGNQQR